MGYYLNKATLVPEGTEGAECRMMWNFEYDQSESDKRFIEFMHGPAKDMLISKLVNSPRSIFPPSKFTVQVHDDEVYANPIGMPDSYYKVENDFYDEIRSAHIDPESGELNWDGFHKQVNSCEYMKPDGYLHLMPMCIEEMYFYKSKSTCWRSRSFINEPILTLEDLEGFISDTKDYWGNEYPDRFTEFENECRRDFIPGKSIWQCL